MKAAYYIFLFLLCTQPILGHSQQMGEWFNQKKTQIRYLVYNTKLVEKIFCMCMCALVLVQYSLHYD